MVDGWGKVVDSCWLGEDGVGVSGVAWTSALPPKGDTAGTSLRQGYVGQAAVTTGASLLVSSVVAAAGPRLRSGQGRLKNQLASNHGRE